LKNIEHTYDDFCRAEFSALQAKIEHLFVDIEIDCPYGLPYQATFHQASFAPLGERVMELFLAAGYRRNGNCLYHMRCKECSACIPLRLHTTDFIPSRSQKRIVKKNTDLTITLLPLRASKDALELCEKFLIARYPKENNNAVGYYRDFFLNSIVNSAQLQFRIGDRLVGVSIIDIGSNWVNAVYFYFDPDESKRSLGTLNICNLVNICQEWGVDHLYLGYLIHNVSAMNYKKNFSPYYLFLDNKWVEGK